MRDAWDSSPVIRPFLVLLRYRRDRNWPENAENQSVITHASCHLRSVKGGRHVTHFRVVEKGLLAVSKPFRGVKHGTVAVGEFLSVPLAAGRRIRPQVDNHVVNGASGAADQFGFLVGLFLVVHTANRAPLKTERRVELNHVRIQAMLNELFAAPSTCEIATVIPDLLLPG